MNKQLLALAVGACFTAPLSSFAAPTVEELWEIIQKQQAEIEALKQGQAKTEKKVEITEERLDVTDEKIEATADAVEQSGGGVPKALEWASRVKIGGYAEHHYNNFDNGDDQIDAHRFVLFVSNEFNDKVRFFSELELEHGVAGDGKPGEVELEQAYIEWDFAENHSLIAGQFLIPVGFLNETHEPDTFYGVERNLVENRIIPTTWWETGALVRGQITDGLSYDVAYHSGLRADETGRIRAARQKSAEAVANDFAQTLRIKYTGVPGLEVAATIQRQENISQGLVEDAEAILTEVHGAYNTGKFAIRALWANWDLDGDAFELNGSDEQEGWYIEPSFKPFSNFGVFARFSSFNTNAGLAENDDNEVVDVGFNYWLHPNVVFKMDYQDASEFNDNDSLNVGVGWSF